MKKYEYIPNLFCISLSFFVMIFAYNMGLWDKASQALEETYNPGPGLMPFFAALFLLLISLYLLISPFLRKGARIKPQKVVNEKCEKPCYGKIILVLACLLGYAFLVEPLGYIVTTFLALFLLFKMMGVKWVYALFASSTTTLVTYFVFSYLGLLLPDGIIELQRYFL